MIVYKYLAREQFFTNFKLRFTPPQELNDPRECVPDIRLHDPRGYIDAVIQRSFESVYFKLLIEKPELTPEQALKAIVDGSIKTTEDFFSNNEEWVRRIFDAFMRVTNRTIGVLSLTESNNNELMWAHYADSHKGFAIGFDSEHSFFKPAKGDPKLCGELMNVQYTDVRPVVYVEPSKLDIPKELFFTKTVKWAYEREWRMIKMLKSASEVINSDIHLFEVPNDAIKEVVFGAKIPPEKKETLIQNLKISAPHITFKSASFDHRGVFVIA